MIYNIFCTFARAEEEVTSISETMSSGKGLFLVRGTIWFHGMPIYTPGGSVLTTISVGNHTLTGFLARF